MKKNIFYLFVCFLTTSFFAKSQSFNNQLVNSQSKAYALLDLGFSGKLLHLNTEGSNSVIKKEEVKKSPRSLDAILAKSKDKKAKEVIKIVNSSKYHLIVGCFSNLNNAQLLVTKLNDQGYRSKIIGQNNLGLHMVAIDSYSSKSDAKREQNALSTEGVSSWIKTSKL